MRIKCDDINIFVEVVGKKLRVEGGKVIEKPTIVFVHGGPAWDHRTLLTDFEPLQDVAQLVFYDHRGLGRSDWSSSEHWNLKTWASDLNNLITNLGLERPIVFGQSFGGAVVQRFAIDYGEAYSGLVLSSTSVRIDQKEVIEACRSVGGDGLAQIAIDHYSGAQPPHRILVDTMKYFTKSGQSFGEVNFRTDVFDHFYAVHGEGHDLDVRNELGVVHAPTLIMGGDRDPMIPAKLQQMLAESLDPAIVQLEIIEECGHGPARDQPEKTLGLLRDFIARVDAAEKIGRGATVETAVAAPPV